MVQETQRTTQVRRRVVGELLWLAPALLAGGCILYFYLDSHPYPSFGAGLYFLIAERIVENGYALPATIPHYTAEGVPFAYPPLMFYVLAVLRDVTGFSSLSIARILPGLVSLAYLVPLYLLGRDLLGSRPQGSLAAFAVAVSPPVLQWHISAGGIVRAPAMLFALTGIYTGLHLFREGDDRWLAPTVLAFTLTVLTHPVYTVFFASSLFLLYLRFDRSLRGLLRGALVALGGVVLTAPWWGQVMAMHGPAVFTAAAGTHGGIGHEIPTLKSLLRPQFGVETLRSMWHLVPIIGSGYLLAQRRYFLPAWFGATALVVGNPRFVFLVGAFVSAAFVVDWVLPVVKREAAALGRQEMATFSVFLVATLGVSGGALYATSHTNAHAGSPSLPQFVDDGDVAAMEWAAENTDPSAEFVVQGDAAEWFPQQTERTILVGPWGVEWRGHEAYRNQLHQFRQLSECHSAWCLTAKLQRASVHPDYVYVPKGRYTVRGMQRSQGASMSKSMLVSPQYQLAFENSEVAIFRVADGWRTPGPPVTGPFPTQ